MVVFLAWVFNELTIKTKIFYALLNILKLKKFTMNVAVVTGGNKGIGLAITKELIKNKYKVIVSAKVPMMIKIRLMT